MKYATIEEVRAILGITDTELSDSDIIDLEKVAIVMINTEIGVDYEDIPLSAFTDTRNTIDGSNKTFYLNDAKWLWDRNNDGELNGDDIYFYEVDSDGNLTEITVSSVDITESKIVLENAPDSSKTQYVSYRLGPVKNFPTANSLVKLATVYLIGFLASSRATIGLNVAMSGFAVGKVRVSGSKPYEEYYKRYTEVLNRLKNSVRSGAYSDEL